MGLFRNSLRSLSIFSTSTWLNLLQYLGSERLLLIQPFSLTDYRSAALESGEFMLGSIVPSYFSSLWKFVPPFCGLDDAYTSGRSPVQLRVLLLFKALPNVIRSYLQSLNLHHEDVGFDYHGNSSPCSCCSVDTSNGYTNQARSSVLHRLYHSK